MISSTPLMILTIWVSISGNDIPFTFLLFHAGPAITVKKESILADGLHIFNSKSDRG
jgi:hypothetical protein